MSHNEFFGTDAGIAPRRIVVSADGRTRTINGTQKQVLVDGKWIDVAPATSAAPMTRVTDSAGKPMSAADYAYAALAKANADSLAETGKQLAAENERANLAAVEVAMSKVPKTAAELERERVDARERALAAVERANKAALAKH